MVNPRSGFGSTDKMARFQSLVLTPRQHVHCSPTHHRLKRTKENNQKETAKNMGIKSFCE
jgi:hypothetical protein